MIFSPKRKNKKKPDNENSKASKPKNKRNFINPLKWKSQRKNRE